MGAKGCIRSLVCGFWCSSIRRIYMTVAKISGVSGRFLYQGSLKLGGIWGYGDVFSYAENHGCVRAWFGVWRL